MARKPPSIIDVQIPGFRFGVMYDHETGKLTIHEGVDAIASGRWDPKANGVGAIVECPYDLHKDPQTSENIYLAIEAALRGAVPVLPLDDATRAELEEQRGALAEHLRIEAAAEDAKKREAAGEPPRPPAPAEPPGPEPVTEHVGVPIVEPGKR
jgi:hypothetical protein